MGTNLVVPLESVPHRGILPPKATDGQLLWLAEVHASDWPAGLRRYTVFKCPARDVVNGNADALRRAIAWDPFTKTLYVQKVWAGKAPDGRKKPETLPGFAQAQEVFVVPDTIRPKFMDCPIGEVPASALVGLQYRNALVSAILMVDKVGNGDPKDFILNEEVIFDSQALDKRIIEVLETLGRKQTYKPYLLELVRKYFHFGGGPTALLRLTPLRGAPGVLRAGINTTKPGPLSFDERLEEAAAHLNGETTFKRRSPVGLVDLKKFAKGLKEFWARGRQSLRQTWRLIRRLFYAKRSKWHIPTFRMFMHHAPGIIVRDNLKALRQGHVLTAQFDRAMPGQSSDLTFGIIEIVDIDGWTPKVGVALKVKGKIVNTTVKVVFAVSRLTGAVLGWEIALKGESGETFVRCIASIFLSKQRRASALGLGVLKGLLHGNIDGVYVDNGAGASEEVVAAAVDRMGLIRDLAPPSQGQKKGRIESLNAALIRMMAEDNLGATRDANALAKEMRRLSRKKGKAMALDDLERYLILAFNYHNLCHDVSNLRTEKMYEADCDIYPADLHGYTQKKRFGDARKAYTEEEVNDRFLPWVEKACRKGVVHFRLARWTSRGLVDYFNEAAKSPGKTKSCSVWVKALTGFQRVLMWRRDDGVKERLEMVPEDARKFGSASWTKMDVYATDDQYRRMKMAKKTPGLRGRMSSDEHQQHVDAQQRLGNPLAGAVGVTAGAAKDAAALKRDQEFGKAEAASYNMEAPEVKSDGVQVVVQAPSSLDQANEDFFRKQGLLP